MSNVQYTYHGHPCIVCSYAAENHGNVMIHSTFYGTALVNKKELKKVRYN